ncbi:replication initiation factor [Burkholderia pseudomallei]
MKRGKGRHTFGERLWIEDQWGKEDVTVQWGGRQGHRVMLEVKGERTPGAVDLLRQATPHRVTRADACVDFERPGAWESLLMAVQDVKQRHDLYGEPRGDWTKPELGRTMYLGSAKSAVRARLYEKGKQPEYRHLGRFDLVRLEVQVRPAKEAKDQYSTLSAREVWGASKWTRDLAAMAIDEQIAPHPASSVTRRPALEERLSWIARQAGPTLLELLQDCGSRECVGLTLPEAVMAESERKKRPGAHSHH